MREYLLIPGPTPLPQRVIQAMCRNMISHRGEDYGKIFGSVLSRLKKIFGTQNEILLFPSSGTGGLESSIANLFSKGDSILSLSCGHFGNRFIQIAEAYGLKVNKITTTWGKTPDLNKMYEVLKQDNTIKGVLITHNETSTGVMLDLKAIGKVLKDFPHVISIVDGVSSVGAIPVDQDKNDLDVVITSSQKALMTPPGISLVSLSKKALERTKTADLPRYYFDYSLALSYQRKSVPQNPYTPPVSLIYGLREALAIIEEEGLENRFKRHRIMRDMVRTGVKAMGLELLAEDEIASYTVTAVFVPDGKDTKIISELKNDYGIVISKGQGELSGKIIRIGHMGYTSYSDLFYFLSSLERVINVSNPGVSVEAAQKILEREKSDV